MECPSCGVDNTPEVQACVECGARLGRADTTLSMLPQVGQGDSGDAPLKSTGGIELVVAKGPSSGARYTVTRDETWLGRDPDSDIFLDDVTVSRKHAKIRLSGERVFVADVGSLNGTYLNGERVDEAELRHGDEMWIGKYKLVFTRSD